MNEAAMPATTFSVLFFGIAYAGSLDDTYTGESEHGTQGPRLAAPDEARSGKRWASVNNALLGAESGTLSLRPNPVQERTHLGRRPQVATEAINDPRVTLQQLCVRFQIFVVRNLAATASILDHVQRVERNVRQLRQALG
jgi:hypothetical protein